VNHPDPVFLNREPVFLNNDQVIPYRSPIIAEFFIIVSLFF